jgi:hypothetical protein
MSCDAAISYGMLEVSTIEWWDKQSEEARNEAFSGTRLPVEVAAELRAFIQNAGGSRCIPWGNGSVFDITLLEGWFDRVNPLKDASGDDVYPWKFWNIADLRTLVRLSGISLKSIPFTGDKHNALADALHQVKIAHAARSNLMLVSDGRGPYRGDEVRPEGGALEHAHRPSGVTDIGGILYRDPEPGALTFGPHAGDSKAKAED